MVSIVRFAGTNCEFDMQYVYERLLQIPTAIIWHKEKSLPRETKLVVLAGGFSYGDYLRSGAIARFAPIMKAIKAFGDSGGRILGICNGFQILTEALDFCPAHLCATTISTSSLKLLHYA